MESYGRGSHGMDGRKMRAQNPGVRQLPRPPIRVSISDPILGFGVGFGATKLHPRAGLCIHRKAPAGRRERCPRLPTQLRNPSSPLLSTPLLAAAAVVRHSLAKAHKSEAAMRCDALARKG